jgi:hypothetical protein
MGYELRRQLREVLGPDITGLQRAVALEIADDANERTRMSIAPLDDLVRWTGAKDGSVVRNALKRLAAAGWEFRVPIGKGKDGRVLYAVPGTRMTFRVPDIQGVATATPSDFKGEQGLTQGGATATPYKPQGGAGAHSEGAGAHSEGAGAPPYSSDSSDPSSKRAPEQAHNDADRIPDAFAYIQPLIAAMTKAGFGSVSWQMVAEDLQSVARVMRRAGVTAMVENAVNAKSRTRKSIGFASYFLKSGWTGLPPQSTAPPSGRQAEKPPWCEDIDCDEKTRTRDVEDDRGLRYSQPCPKCHPAARKDSAA